MNLPKPRIDTIYRWGQYLYLAYLSLISTNPPPSCISNEREVGLFFRFLSEHWAGGLRKMNLSVLSMVSTVVRYFNSTLILISGPEVAKFFFFFGLGSTIQMTRLKWNTQTEAEWKVSGSNPQAARLPLRGSQHGFPFIQLFNANY